MIKEKFCIVTMFITYSMCCTYEIYWRKFAYTGPVTLSYYNLIPSTSVNLCIAACWPLHNWDQILFQGEDCYCLAPVYEKAGEVSGTVTTNSEFWTIHQNVSSCSINNYTIFEANNYCLKYFSFAATFSEAERHCQEDGGHLVSVNTPEDFTNFRSVYPEGISIHIGGHRTLDDAQFAWITGGYVNDTLWRINEPNNYKGLEDCVIVNDRWEYNDEYCHKRYPFICQILTV